VQRSGRSAEIRVALAFEGLGYRNLPVRIFEPDHPGAARCGPDSKVLLPWGSEFPEANSLFAVLRHSVLDLVLELRNFPFQDCKLRRLVPGNLHPCDHDAIGVPLQRRGVVIREFDPSALPWNSPAGQTRVGTRGAILLEPGMVPLLVSQRLHRIEFCSAACRI
jgi:hypothetical protein